jgi:hypothetical protein
MFELIFILSLLNTAILLFFLYPIGRDYKLKQKHYDRLWSIKWELEKIEEWRKMNHK